MMSRASWFLVIFMFLCFPYLSHSIQIERYNVDLVRGGSGSLKVFENCTKVILLSQIDEHERLLELNFHPRCESALAFSHLGGFQPTEYVLEFLAEADTAYLIAVHFAIKENPHSKNLIKSGLVPKLRVNQTLSTVLNLQQCKARVIRLPRYRQLLGGCGRNLYEWQPCENFEDLHYVEQSDLDDFVLAVRHDHHDAEINVAVYLIERLQAPEPSFASTLQIEVTPSILIPVSHNALSTDDTAAFFRVLSCPEKCSFLKANTRSQIKQFSQLEIDSLEIALLCEAVETLQEVKLDLVNILGEESNEKFSLSLTQSKFRERLVYNDVIVNANGSSTLFIETDESLRFWTMEGLTRGVLIQDGLSVNQFDSNVDVFYNSSAKEISTDNLILKPDSSTFQFLVPAIVVPSNINFFLRFESITVSIGQKTTLTRNLLNYPTNVYIGDLVFSLRHSFPSQGEFLVNGKRVTTFTLDDILNVRAVYSASRFANVTTEHVLVSCGNSLFTTEFELAIHYRKDGITGNSFPRKAKHSDLQMKVSALGNERIAFDRSHLTYEDSDGNSCPQDIQFKITTSLSDSSGLSSLGNGYIADANGRTLSQFSQRDINSGKVFYHPPTSVSDRLQPRSLSFSFSVSDKMGNKLSNHQFYIYLDSVKIDKSFKVNLTVGPNVVIFGNNIVNEAFNSSHSRFVLTEAPRNGALKDRDNMVLTVGDIFTFNELMSGVIRYVPSQKSTLKDSLELIVYDHRTHAGIPKKNFYSIRINFLSDGSSSGAEQLDNASWRMKVMEGGTKSMLISGSNPVPVELPKQGQVSINEEWSTKGLVNITYIHTGDEVGLEKGHDSFVLHIKDGKPVRVEVQILPVDNSPPEITLPFEVRVPEGNNVTLGIKVNDRDSLQFTCDITEPPNLGYLSSPQGFVLSFTQENVDKLVYVQNLHYQQEPRKDSFSFLCSDGLNSSPENVLNIEITPTNDEQPYLSVDDVTVLEGKIAPVKMKFTDRDIPKDKLVFTITKKPEHGTVGLLQANGDIKQVDGFPDSDANRLAYEHDGSEVNFDNFELTLSDGTHNFSFSTPVHVLAVDDEMPFVVVNSDLSFNARKSTKITERNLKAEDKDTSPDKITYVVIHEPQFGSLVRDNNEIVSKFTQSDLNSNRISYMNSWKLCCFNDSFTFKVTDGYNTGPRQNFTLEIIKPLLDDMKPKSIMLTSTAFRYIKLNGSVAASLETKDLTSESDVDLLWILSDPISGKLKFNKGETPLLQYTMSQEAVEHMRTKDSFNLMLRTELQAKENISVSAEWCWLLLAVEDDQGFLGDQLNVTVSRRGPSVSADVTLAVGGNRLPLTLDKDQSSISLQAEVPPLKENEVVLELSSSRGCLIHPDSRKIIPAERVKSSLMFEHSSYTVQEPRNGTMRVFLKVTRTDKLTSPIKFKAVTSQQLSGAVSGVDFSPLNQEFELSGAARSVLIPLKILADRDTEDDEAFFVNLNDFYTDRLLAKATITIIDIVSSEMMFSSAPVVLSLNDDGSPLTHTTKLNRGYPLLCVTECDRRHPAFSTLSPVCAHLDTGNTPPLSVSYRWKWALHNSDDLEPLIPPSRFNSPGKLESFLLVPGSRISCSVRLQLAPREGQLGRGRGEELESSVYEVTNDGVCPNTLTELGSRPYTSTLSLLDGGAPSNPHIRLVVTIPHHDGLLPFVSTFPIQKSDLNQCPRI